MFKPIVILLFFSLVSFSTLTKASYDYAVIPTQQKAQVIMRQLKPLFSDSVKFSAKGYQLIVKASPTIIKEIKHVLKQIDRPLQNLIIRIANSQTVDQLIQNNQFSAQIEANANIQTIKRSKGAKVKITSTQRQSDRQEDQIYSARVIEGSWVTIYTGVQFPYYSYNGGYMDGNYINRSNKKMTNRLNRPRNNYNFLISPEMQYKEIDSGFDAKAILKNDNQVIVELRAQNNQRDKTYQKSINTRSTNTTISGNLNEWIEIGNIGQVNQNNSGTNYNLNRESQELYYIRVESTQ